MQAIIIKFISVFMFKKVSKFFLKAIVKSTKNELDDAGYDIFIGIIDKKPKMVKKGAEDLLESVKDMIEDVIDDRVKKGS